MKEQCINNNYFGNELKQFLKEKNITYEQFSQIIGVDIRTIANWTSGSKIPNRKNMLIVRKFMKENK